jgi:hypothetical protein
VEPLEGQKERSSAPSLGGQRAAMRMVKDERDGVVLVYELEPSKTNPQPPALVFESRRESLRLSQFPTDWRRLTPEQLLALRNDHS